MFADQAKAFLQLGRNSILQPEQMIRFKALAQACCLDRSKAMMYVVK